MVCTDSATLIIFGTLSKCKHCPFPEEKNFRILSEKKGSAVNPMAEYLVEVKQDNKRRVTDDEQVCTFYNAVAQLFVTIQCQTNFQTAVALFSTKMTIR